MKKLIIIGNIILAGTFFLASCDSTTSEKIEGRADTIGSKIEASVDSMGYNDADDDADFVREAVKSNNMELHMLADGKTKGTDAELKSAAKKMEADHKKLANEMKAYASKKNIELDTADADHDDHDAAKGADWDKKWVNDMVDDHERDIKKFEDAEKDVQDAELKSMISKALPTLREHLEMSKKLQQKFNK
jgi:putative membrane protein